MKLCIVTFKALNETLNDLFREEGNNMIFRLFRNNYRNIDERVVKETDKIFFQCYLIMEILSLMAIPLILYVGKTKLWDFWGVFLSLIICNCFILMKFKINNFRLFDSLRGEDEFMLDFRNRIFRESYYIAFSMILFLDFIITIYFSISGNYNFDSVNTLINYSKITLINLMIIMIPALYFTVIGIKKGVFSFNLDKIDEIKGKKVNLNSFRLRVLYGAVFFGAFMGISALGHSGIKEAIITAICAGAFWGIFFYISMRIMLKVSERNSKR